MIDICDQKEDHFSLGGNYFKLNIQIIIEFPVIKLPSRRVQSAGSFPEQHPVLTNSYI